MYNTHQHDEARRHAEHTVAMVNRELSNPKHANNAKKRHMLTNMKEKAMQTIEHHNRMYETQNNDYDYDYDEYNYVDETENRRGVKGTGRYGTGGVDRRRTSPIRGGRGRRRGGRRAYNSYDENNYDYNGYNNYSDYDSYNYNDLEHVARTAANNAVRNMTNNNTNYPIHLPVVRNNDYNDDRYERNDRNDRNDRQENTSNTGIGPRGNR